MGKVEPFGPELELELGVPECDELASKVANQFELFIAINCSSSSRCSLLLLALALVFVRQPEVEIILFLPLLLSPTPTPEPEPGPVLLVLSAAPTKSWPVRFSAKKSLRVKYESSITFAKCCPVVVGASLWRFSFWLVGESSPLELGRRHVIAGAGRPNLANNKPKFELVCLY